jgi:hypothetical protein
MENYITNIASKNITRTFARSTYLRTISFNLDRSLEAQINQTIHLETKTTLQNKHNAALNPH